MEIINLNCAAGLECSDRIINALTYDLKNFNGNPNANNQRGVSAQIEISYTRAHVATDLNARLTTEILFTSGACESNTYCVGQWLKATPNSYLVTTKTEHASILRLAESTNNSKYVSVNNKGCINLGELERLYQKLVIDLLFQCVWQIQRQAQCRISVQYLESCMIMVEYYM